MSLAAIARDQFPRTVNAASVWGTGTAGTVVDGVKVSGLAPKQPDGFEMLTRYIPTETITLYVAVMAAHKDIASTVRLTPWGIYSIFAVLTPLLLALLSYRAFILSDRISPFRLHWWPPVAALAAFMVWGLAILPEATATARSLSALGALILSTFLSLLDPIFVASSTPAATPKPPPHSPKV